VASEVTPGNLKFYYGTSQDPRQVVEPFWFPDQKENFSFDPSQLDGDGKRQEVAQGGASFSRAELWQGHREAEGGWAEGLKQGHSMEDQAFSLGRSSNYAPCYLQTQFTFMARMRERERHTQRERERENERERERMLMDLMLMDVCDCLHMFCDRRVLMREGGGGVCMRTPASG
jgi:hypothetical protein